MEFRFNSIPEIMAFVGCLTAKAKKGEVPAGDETEAPSAPQAGNSPAPLAPPTTAAAAGFPGGQTGFTVPPAGGAAPQAGAFPAPAAPAIDPNVAAWVAKISGVIDTTANTPKAGEMLQWFRNSFGTEAASATAEQIKTIFLPRLNVEQIAQMGKMMGLS